MNRTRFVYRVCRLLSTVVLVTALLLATAPSVLADGAWTHLEPPTPSARSGHAMVSIGGDQALLFGGYAGGIFLGDTWVYDLSANTWTEMVPAVAPSARWSHALAYLGGDQVLLFGGSSDGSNFLGDTWTYDLSANTWTQRTPVSAPSWRYHHAMAPVGDGIVLLFGGYDGTYSDETWVYELRGNTWTEHDLKTAPDGRTLHALAPAGDDAVVLFGGWNGTTHLGDTWLYDLSADTWHSQAPVTHPSSRGSAAMVGVPAFLNNDRVLVFGGDDGSYRADTWVYDVSDNAWTDRAPVAPTPAARSHHTMATLGAGQVLLFGGIDAVGTFGDTWSHDVAENTWTDQTPPVPPARYWHAMASIGADGALVFGGKDNSAELLGDTWAYDLSTGNWTDEAPAVAPSARCYHAMASLGDDKVLLFGGTETQSDDWLGDTWVYDLSDGAWTEMAPAAPPPARWGHSLAPIGTGQVLMFGGTYDHYLTDETWLYDLASNSWTQQSPAAHPSARYGAAMASLGGDRVVMFGGWLGLLSGETWIYDLSDNAWTNVTAASGPAGRDQTALASFGAGRALLFGGYDGSQFYGDTWIFDARTDLWSLSNPAVAPSARFRHSMTSVGEGQALLFGGWAVDVVVNAQTWLAVGFEPAPIAVYLPLVIR